MSMVTHYPWDGGAIDAAFKQIFGVGTLHKTVKAVCGRRVSTAHASADGVSCPACLDKIREELAMHEAFTKERPDLIEAVKPHADRCRKALGAA